METIGEVQETMAMDLGSLLDAGDGAVVTLVAGDTRLVAHKTVLSARSPVFAAMFRHNTLEASRGEVAIPDVEGPVLRQLLAYLYTLKAPQLPGMAPQLLAASDKYGVSVLKAECEKQVAAQLSVDTAVTTALLAIRHSCATLRQAAIAYIKTHAFEVMATQGYADAVHTQPKDIVELSRLLSETSAPAPADSGNSPATQPHSDQGDGSSNPASDAPPTAASHHTPPPDDVAVSPLHAPAPADSGNSPATQPRSDQGDGSSNPASDTPPTAASHHNPPPDDAAVSPLQSLSAEEKAKRLIEAAKEGAVGELEALLAAGADVGARDEGIMCGRQTALHCAADGGHVEAVRRLLAAGADVEATSSSQRTPLHSAARSGRAAVVRLLLAAGADHTAWDTSRMTPLHVAANCGNATVVRVLLAAGAEHGARAEERRTPLHYAAYWGHIEAAAALLEGGADRWARNNKGRTPLEVARQRYHHQQLLDLLQPPRD